MKEHNLLWLLRTDKENEENFNYLIRLMKRNVVVPFLGAGFSANFKYPGWVHFLEEQGKKYNLPKINEELLKRKEYEKAASLLKEKLQDGLEYVLIKNFGDHIYKSANVVRELELLPQIFRSLILTTNFDEVIEMLYAKKNGEYIAKLTPKTIKDTRLIYNRIAFGEPTLIKLHGDVATREFVLTEQEYDKTYGHNTLDFRLPLPSFLRDILLSKIILFIGCSLEDDRTLKVIKQAQVDGSISFALLQYPKEDKVEERKEFLNKHHIIPIWYPEGEYDALKIFMQAIAEKTSQQYYQSVTITKSALEKFMADGDNACNSGNITYALYSYMEAEKLLKNNSESFSVYEKKEVIKKIKLFYERYSDCYEHKEIWMEWIKLTDPATTSDLIELAMCYHGLAYSFEKYNYYKLFLKSMLKAEEIMQKFLNLTKDECSDFKEKMDKEVYRKLAFLYTGVGYAYIRNDNTLEAKIWYEEVEKMKDFLDVEDDVRAFIYNGLYRYYENIQNQFEQAVETLDKALEIRKKIYSTETSNRQIVKHLVNSYSNKISLYLSHGKINEAEKEYENFLAEQDIWERLNDNLLSKIRILSDFGDILMAKGKYRESYDKYGEVLNYRRKLHLVEDVRTAELYLKMADCMNNIEGENRWAIEYLIQAYLIKKRVLGNNDSTVQNLYKRILDLGMKLHDTEEIILKRISIQERFLGYHYDEGMDKREDELIAYFNL